MEHPHPLSSFEIDVERLHAGEQAKKKRKVYANE